MDKQLHDVTLYYDVKSDNVQIAFRLCCQFEKVVSEWTKIQSLDSDHVSSFLSEMDQAFNREPGMKYGGNQIIAICIIFQ